MPLLGLAIGGHLFLRWLHDAMKPARSPGEANQPRAWRVRWTAMLLGLLFLAFATIISAGLVFHQVGWLLTAPPSIYRAPNACVHTGVLLASLPYGVGFGQPPQPLHPDWLACVQFVPIVDEAGNLREFLAYARDPQQQREFGVCVAGPDRVETRPVDDLDQILVEARETRTRARRSIASENGYCGSFAR